MSQAIEERLKSIETMLQILLKQQSSPETEDLIDIEEAAVLCTLSKRTLYNYMDTGKFRVPITKQGKAVLFKRQDVIRWNAERTIRKVPALKSSAVLSQKHLG